MSNRIRTETRRLPVVLSDEELEGLSQELAQAIQDRKVEEERQKSAKSVMKGTMEGFEAKMQRLSTNIVRKEIERDVEVDLMLDLFHVTEVRRDTGEVVLTRPAMPQELQLEFPAES